MYQGLFMCGEEFKKLLGLEDMENLHYFKVRINNAEDLHYFEKMNKKFYKMYSKEYSKTEYLINGVLKLRAIQLKDEDVLLHENLEVLEVAWSYNNNNDLIFASSIVSNKKFSENNQKFLSELLGVENDLEAIKILDRKIFPKDFEKTFGRRPRTVQKEMQISLINVMKNIESKKEKEDSPINDIETETIKNIELGKLSFMDELEPVNESTLKDYINKDLEEKEEIEEEIEMNKLEVVENMLIEINRKMKLSTNVAPGYENIPGIKEAVNNAIVVDIDMTIAELQKIRDELVIDSIFTIVNINELSIDERLELGGDIFGLIKIPKENSYIYLARVNNQNVVLNIAKSQIGAYDVNSKKANMTLHNNQCFSIVIPDTHIDLNILSKHDNRFDNNFRGFGFKAGFGNPGHLV